VNETCAACGFDASDYTHNDLLGTLRALAPIWRTTAEGIDASVLAARPAEGVWSALEYAAHSRDVTAMMSYAVTRALEEETPDFGAPPEAGEPAVPDSLAAAIAQLDKHVAKLNGAANRMGAAGWARPFVVGGEVLDVRWAIAHAAHDATHHLRDVGRGLHALGAGAPSQKGTVAQVNTSGGGVPKHARPHVEVDRRGVVGDTQAERKHHGKPLQALSLWSGDIIDALRAEGHTVYPGAAGENVTVSGIDWTTIRPGVRIDVGAVRAEISAFATPCAKNAQWFSDRNFKRIDHNLHPGWSRAYAWVIEGGAIGPGDAVVVEP
jgi:MOSC domain-containing protein YiiM